MAWGLQMVNLEHEISIHGSRIRNAAVTHYSLLITHYSLLIIH